MAKSYPANRGFSGCMAFTVHEVVRVAYLSSHANHFVNAKASVHYFLYCPVINGETKFASVAIKALVILSVLYNMKFKVNQMKHFLQLFHVL